MSVPTPASAASHAMMRDKITGKTYLEQYKPVRVLARWGTEPAPAWAGISFEWLPRSDGKPHPRSGPHNVLIEREDGSRVVWPFRGLQRSQNGAE